MRYSLLLVAALTLAFAQVSETGWDLTGTVTYNGKPVKDAWVSVEGVPRIKPVSTDGQGHYSLKGDAPGLYTFTALVENENIELTSRSLTLVAGGHLKADFLIPKGGVFSGRVLDRDKRPISGLFVEALSKSVDPTGVHMRPVGEDRTNDLGEYRITHLPPGVYVLSASARAKLPKLQKGAGAASSPGMDYPLDTFFPGTTALEGAVAFELHPGEEQPALDIVVRKQASRCISLKVGGAFYVSSDADHPDTEVSLEPWLGPSVTGVMTEVTGEPRANEPSRVCGLVAGEYRLNFLTLAGGNVLRALSYLSVPFTLKDEDVDLGSLEIPAPVEMRGTVSLEGAPQDAAIPAGIRVRLLSTDSFWLMHDDGGIAPVQPDGSFKAPRVFPSDYAVRLLGLPAGYYVKDASQQGRDVRNGGLRSGGGDLKITLGIDGPTVSGRVLAEDGTPVPDASVLLAPKDPGRTWVAQSDQNGAYRFPAGFAPGEYRIAAFSSLLESQRLNTAIVTRLAAGGTDLTLYSHESRSIDLKITEAR